MGLRLSLIFLLSTSSAVPIRPCPGLSTRRIDLLGHSFSEKSSTAFTAEIVVADCKRGFRLGDQAVTLGVNSDDILRTCESLPSEFSLHLSFLHSTPHNYYEYLLTLLAQDMRTVLFSVRYRKNSILFEYIREGDQSLASVEYFNEKLNDRSWHELTIAVAGNEVRITLDCTEKFVKILDHAFDFTTDIRKTRFFIGSRNRKRRRFTGIIRHISLAIGADISTQICSKHFSEGDQKNRYDDRCPSNLPRSDCLATTACSDEELHGGNRSPRFNYLKEYKDIVTINQTIDIEVFHIHGFGHFLATANRGDTRKSKSGIYRWRDDKYEILQEVPSKQPQHWKHFTIGDEHFLALANSGRGRSHDVRSPIYRWEPRKNKFVRIQLLATHSARSWEAFEIDGKYYLAVANYMDDNNNTRNLSEIFLWNKDVRNFTPYQKLPSNGATDIEFLDIVVGELKYHVLIIANTFDGQTTKLNSSVFYWNSGKFFLLQQIETYGAGDLETFKVDGNYYIAVANTVLFDGRDSETKRNYQIDSAIYELNFFSQRFVKVQSMKTSGAKDWEYFTVGADSYLVVSNIFSKQEELVSTVIYKWQGVEKFVVAHNFTSKSTSDIEHVVIGSEHYLIAADPNSKYRSKLYKIVTY